MQKTIYLHGEFGVDILSDVVIPQIDSAIAEKATTITIDISSFGGSVKTGREIMGAIERAKMAGILIETRCLSYAYSMGANVFLMGTKGHRRISEHTEIMIHPVMGMAEGNAVEIMQVATTLQEMSDNLLGYILKGNEANSEKIRAAFESQKMIGAAEAIELGLADGYVEKLAAVAYYSKNTDMNLEDNKKAKSLFEKIEAWFNKAEGVKNASTTAGDTTFYYEGSLAVGTKVYSDEAMTSALADGTYGDYTCAGGEITSISSEAENLKKQIEELTAKLATVEAEKATAEADKVKAENEKAELEAANKSIEATVAELKALFVEQQTPDGKPEAPAKPEYETISQRMKRLDAENRAKYSNIN